MSFRHTFEDYAPSGRTSGSWTGIEFWEGTSPETLVKIDTQAISPPYANPAAPEPRTFVTDDGALAAGWFQLVFTDTDGNREPTTPFYGPVSYRPSVSDVGALLRARTVPAGSDGELGTFTAETRPTGEEVERLIDEAVNLISVQLPVEPLPARLAQIARTMAAIQAAVLVELSYFPEQVSEGASIVEALERRLEGGLTGLTSAGNDNQPNRARYGSIPITTVTSVDVLDGVELLP